MISAHISLREATASQTATRLGIPNTPPASVLDAMRTVAEACFEPARAHFGKAILVSSFYRSPALNAAIGGSPTSDHCLGRAIDLDSDDPSNLDLFNWLRENVPFDQLINEFPDEHGNPDWVHISYRSPSTNRQQVLRARRRPDRGVTYEVMP